jgi:hypothetical protein
LTAAAATPVEARAVNWAACTVILSAGLAPASQASIAEADAWPIRCESITTALIAWRQW